MYQETYQLIVTGSAIQGMAPAQVAENLAKAFKFSRAQIQQLLSGKPRIVKSALDLESIQYLREKLIGAGLNCEIKMACNEANFRSALKFSRPQDQSKQGLGLSLSPEPDLVRTRLSFRAYDFNPKLFSRFAREIVKDSRGVDRFEINREKFYLGWLLLVPAFAVFAYAISTASARTLVTVSDNNSMISLITVVLFFLLWIGGLLWARPTTLIDIVDITRARELFVLQQSGKMVVKYRTFSLATDMESQNATLHYDTFHNHCVCESVDGFVIYRSVLQQNANDTIFGVAGVLVDYLKDIPAHLFSSIESARGNQYKVYDQDDQHVGSYTIGKQIIVDTHQAESNTAYLIAMALINAGA